MVSGSPARMRKPRARYHHGDLHEAALVAAAEEIDAHGHVAFTMERVAKRLGVTPAALYRHYKNRDALLREVSWRIFQRYVEAVDSAALAAEQGRREADDGIDGIDPLEAIGRAYVRFAMANPGWFRLQFSVAGSALSDRQSAAQTKYAEVMQRSLAALFPGDEALVMRWFMSLWAAVHGAACMAGERVIPPLESDAARIAVADEQLALFLEGLHAAAAQRRAKSKRRSASE
jgi:AcrR family transcriptional regulator